MPNHCSNDLRIPRLIREFIDFARAKRKTHDIMGEEKEFEERLSCDRFVPYPQRFKDQDEKACEATREMQKLPKKERDFRRIPKDGFNSGGYEWYIDNWGTKWGCYNESEWKLYKRSALIRFDSAWSPPKPVISAMAKRFPRLRFTLRYYERGMGFKGCLQVKDEKVLKEEYSREYRGHRGG